MRAGRAKRSRGFDQRLVGISDRSVVRSEIVDADRAVSAKRSWALPVGSKASFPFHLSASEVRKNGPSIHVHWASVFDRRQMFCKSAAQRAGGRAGESTMALRWGGRTDRARN